MTKLGPASLSERSRQFRQLNTSDFGDPPECFSEQEWRDMIPEARAADPYVRPARFNRDFLMRKACEDCTLLYQFTQKLRGRCHPPEGVLTPIQRAEAGINDLLDEPLRKGVQRV